MPRLIEPAFLKDYNGLGPLLKMRRDPLRYFINTMNETGTHTWFKLAGRKVVLLNDAASIRHVLHDNANNYRKGRFNDVLKPLLGNGIFLSEKDLWLKQRRESAPVFAQGNFPEMTAQMAAAVEAMITRWEPKIDRNEPIDLYHEMMWFALDVLFRTLFHEEKQDIAEGVQESLGHLLGECERRIWALLSLPQSWVLKLPKYKKSMQFLEDVAKELIDKRRENKAYPEDLLSRLIDHYSDNKQDRKVLRDQVMCFLLAGHETTANGLAWAFYETGLHPDIQQKLREEVETVCGHHAPDYSMARNLNYTRQAFDEALRLYPPVWTFSREALEEDTIPLDNGDTLAMPKGASAMLCPYAIQRRAGYWPQPDAFMPDRFAPENTATRPGFSYFPFGGGPRLCLGFRFAQIESVVALAMVAQRFEWSLVPGQAIKAEPVITLRPSGPIYFTLKRRQPMALENPQKIATGA